MKKILFLLACAVIPAAAAFAQFPYLYSFSQHTTPFVKLGNNATVLSAATPWGQLDNFKAAITFPFNVFGMPVDSAMLNPGSGMTFNASTAAAFWVFSGAGIVDGTPNNTSVSKVRYEISGTPGNRMFKMEVDSAGFIGEYFSNNAFTSYITYQIWLAEADSSIELHIGNISVQNPMQIYINGTGPTIGMLHFNTQMQADYSLFATGAPAAATASFSNSPDLANLPSLNNTPVTNVVYRFEPTFAGVGTGPENEIGSLLHVYPNPAAGNITVSWNNTNAKAIDAIKVYNATGAEVLSLAVEGTQSCQFVSKTISLETLSSGAYFVRVGNSKAIGVVKR